MKCLISVLLISIICAVQSEWLLDKIVSQLHTASNLSPMFCMIPSTTRSGPLQDVYQQSANLGNQQLIIASNISNENPSRKCTHVLVGFNGQKWQLVVNIMAELFRKKIWNNCGCFIFITESSFNSNLLVQYVALMDTYGIANSVLIFCEESQAHGWDYFTKRILDFESIFSMVNHLRENYLLDVMGNPFRASFKADIPTMMTTIQTQFGGSFVQLLRIYARYINASLRWHFGLGQESEQARNKLFTNAMVDFAPNAGFNHRYLDYIHGNTPGYLVLLIPEKMNDPFFESLLIPFSTALWIAIFVILIVCSLLHSLFKQYFPRNIVLMIFFGSATAEHALQRSERLLSASLTVIIFLLCESYLAIMVSYMLDVKYRDHLQTIADLERSSIYYCLKPGEDPAIYKRFFNVFSPTLAGRIIRPKTSYHWYDIESCSWMLRHEVAQVFLGSEQNYDRNTMRRKMYMLPQMLSCMSRLHSVSRLRPFREHFLTVQQRMIDAGFWQHWNDAVMSAVLIRKWDTFSVFSFDDLISLWYILVYGYLLSLAGFIGEICFRKRNYLKIKR